jgi:hypothetical protein
VHSGKEDRRVETSFLLHSVQCRPNQVCCCYVAPIGFPLLLFGVHVCVSLGLEPKALHMLASILPLSYTPVPEVFLYCVVASLCLSIHLFFWWGWGLNSEQSTCRAVPLEPHPQSVLLWLFLEMGSHELFVQDGLQPRSSQSQPLK